MDVDVSVVIDGVKYKLVLDDATDCSNCDLCDRLGVCSERVQKATHIRGKGVCVLLGGSWKKEVNYGE